MTVTQKIYTTGYAGREVGDLKGLLITLDADLIDVRFAPMSRHLEWRKTYLQLLLKEKYRHVPHLGNRTFREGKVSIQNLDLGIKVIGSMNTNLVLMCGCADLKMCHRFIIAHELRRRGFEIEELENWKAAQTTLF